MPTPLQRALQASLFAWWQQNFPLPVPTVYAGLPLPDPTWPAWIELWCQAWTPAAQRIRLPHHTSVLVTAHVLAQAPESPGFVCDLTEAVAGCLHQRALPVRNYSAAGHPTIAHLTFREAQVQDFTWQDGPAALRGLRHLVVSCLGLAETLPA